ncbi:hypothetical protein KST88_02515 [Fusobacterium nucleatum]|uniref:hypothetical protein n=1 Tax=Fusobacterium nucleatum TaxID=851 RepID=UPI0030D60493
MKNYTLEFTSGQWNLYTEKETYTGAEVLKLFPDLKDLAKLEDEYTSINAYWDNTEERGYIDVEITAVHSDSTYPFKTKYYDFSKFLKDLKDLENEIEIDKLNVNDWEYEKQDPYGSRGLSIRDFI